MLLHTIFLLLEGDKEEHVFHLHGYQFYVVGVNIFDRPVTIEDVRTLDYHNTLFKRNLASPALKDTIRVPRFGAVAVRFIANNPGLRSHFITAL